MNLLTFDTCCGLCSVAIFQGKKEVFYAVNETPNMQAEELFPLIEQGFSKTNFGYDDLDAIGITIGPGSFTGIRVGMSAAYSFASLKKTPLIGVSTMELLANSWPIKNKDVCVTLAAGRGRFYCQKFSISNNVISTSEITLLESSQIEIFSQTLEIIGDYVKRENIANALNLGRFINDKYNAEDLKNIEKSPLPKPIYNQMSSVLI